MFMYTVTNTNKKKKKTNDSLVFVPNEFFDEICTLYNGNIGGYNCSKRK